MDAISRPSLWQEVWYPASQAAYPHSSRTNPLTWYTEGGISASPSSAANYPVCVVLLLYSLRVKIKSMMCRLPNTAHFFDVASLNTHSRCLHSTTVRLLAPNGRKSLHDSRCQYI